jgi:hypothetical protein
MTLFSRFVLGATLKGQGFGLGVVKKLTEALN